MHSPVVRCVAVIGGSHWDHGRSAAIESGDGPPHSKSRLAAALLAPPWKGGVGGGWGPSNAHTLSRPPSPEASAGTLSLEGRGGRG